QRRDTGRGRIIKCKLHDGAMQAGICADAVERTRDHESRKQHEEHRGDNNANHAVRNDRTTLTHYWPPRPMRIRYLRSHDPHTRIGPLRPKPTRIAAKTKG